jgi:hypothetical protein
MLEMKLFTKFIKKIFFYSILFTGIVLSSMIFDNLIDTKDDSGYLIAVGICCLTFFILEYLLPKIKN